MVVVVVRLVVERPDEGGDDVVVAGVGYDLALLLDAELVGEVKDQLRAVRRKDLRARDAVRLYSLLRSPTTKL